MLTIKKINPKIAVKLPNSLIVVRSIVGVLCFIITFIIIVNEAAPIKYELKQNELSKADIFAPKDIEDKLTTEKLRNEAEISIAPVYDFDKTITTQLQQRIYDFLSDVQVVRQLEGRTIEQKVEKFKELSTEHIALEDEMLKAFIRIHDNELAKLQITVLNVHRQIMDTGVERGQVDKAKEQARELVEKAAFAKQLQNMSFAILDKVIAPNKILNDKMTDLEREKARNLVSPVIYREGERIIGEREKAGVHHIEMLRELDLLQDDTKKWDYRFMIGVFCIVMLLFIVMMTYLYLFNRKILESKGDLILLGLIFLVSLSFAVMLKLIPFKFIFIVPLITAAMLIAILIETRLAIVMNLVLSILIALIIKGDGHFIGLALLSGTIAAFSVTKAYHRSRLVFSGVVVSLVNALLILGYGLLSKGDLKEVFTDATIIILYSLFAIFLTIGILPFLEATFNIVTPLKLLELSNPNQPLIKKLLLEAPGTYHHSLMVGNLAEAATEEIGGNALLARVAAYYHDIGKLRRPYFFKENQYDDNPHDRMTPNLSTLVITSHTKDGLEMAKDYKLPLVIRDIIAQHHGTTLVAYFYHKAMKNEKEEMVNVEDFRYEGPRPQSNEGAVVMLADCVEAAVRSMPEITEGKIEGLVRKIIKDKLDDGQLNMCDLTLKDLDTIAKAFLRALSGFFHERIEYPEIKVKDSFNLENKS